LTYSIKVIFEFLVDRRNESGWLEFIDILIQTNVDGIEQDCAGLLETRVLRLSPRDKLPDLRQSPPHFLDLLLDRLARLRPVVTIIQEEIYISFVNPDTSGCCSKPTENFQKHIQKIG
jgi:hypothetical protein